MAGYRMQDTCLSSFSGSTRESRRCPRKSRELYKELDSPIKSGNDIVVIEEFEMYEKGSQIRQSPNINRGSYIMHRASCIMHHDNEKGIALVMVLVLSAIALAIMAGLIYMITSGTQISGTEKRYKTALEAGVGGADITYQLIGARGNPLDTTLTTALSLSITTPAGCTRSAVAACSIYAVYTGLAAKLNLPTSCWTGCDSSLTINPAVNISYDMQFDLGTSPYPTYRVFAKIVDTVEGNSGGDEGLLGKGVVSSGTGEVAVMSMPYLYTIEVDAQDLANPAERAKLSILYQY